MAEIQPQAKALGVINTTEQWTLLVEASDAWTRYLDARRERGRQLAELGERPPWSRQSDRESAGVYRGYPGRADRRRRTPDGWQPCRDRNGDAGLTPSGTTE